MPTDGSIFEHGAHLVPGIVTDRAAERLLEAIDREPWSSEIGRRVQHYGYRYDYRAKGAPEPTTPFPEWAKELADIVKGWFIVSSNGSRDPGAYVVPTQCIVNEYTPGQGIGMHTDAPTFGAVVVSVTLGSDWEMRFRHARAHRYERDGLDDDERAVLPVGSALILSGRARLEWMHGICRKQSGQEASRRVSATFRTVE